jgi:ribosomal 50S subunit-recycling heat shock protein
MRLDKFLKKSGLIKRRVVAHDLCEGNKISKNNRLLKPSYEVKIGDVLEIEFARKIIFIEVDSEMGFSILKEKNKDMTDI